jgi:hypothetical protein
LNRIDSTLPLFPIPTNRDVLLFEFPSGDVLVVGCDSAGGVGPKPLDKVKVDGYTLGKFTARAALMEVLSVGACPVCVVDALGVEPEPTGAEILTGIRDEAEKAGLDRRLAVTGSTEKNFAVEQTGIGVTVIGTCKRKELKIGVSSPSDIIVALGTPCVGDEVIPAEKDGKIADTTDALKLRKLEFIHEMIPVGSMGISHEIKTLADGSKLKFKLANQQEIDVRKSAGPATVILASLPDSQLSALERGISKPINVVGSLF